VKRKIVSGFIIGGFLILLLSSIFFQVDETQFAIITQFGKPTRVITSAGLNLKWPDPIQSVRRFDRRLLLFDPEPSEFLTQDKKNILADIYMGWRIREPLRRYLPERPRLRSAL